jgi:hypothetical protein
VVEVVVLVADDEVAPEFAEDTAVVPDPPGVVVEVAP